MRRRGFTVGTDQITLICSYCYKERSIRRTDEDTDRILDREAPGWLTTLSGACACPKCTTMYKLSPIKALVTIHGKDDNHGT
jgi:hypothetical protein